MIGAAHSLSAHVVREIQRGGREREGGRLGTTRDANGKGDAGTRAGWERRQVAAGPAGKKKAKVERFGRKMWASWSASNFKEPDDHLKRRSHPFWLLHRGLVLSRLASLRQTSRRRVWIWSGGLRTLLPGLRSSSSFRSLEKKRARRAHLVSLP